MGGMAPIQSSRAAAIASEGRHVSLKLKDIREFLLDQRMARNTSSYSLAEIDSKVPGVDCARDKQLQQRIKEDPKIDVALGKTGEERLRYKPEFEIKDRGGLLRVIRDHGGLSKGSFGIETKRLEDCYKNVKQCEAM